MARPKKTAQPQVIDQTPVAVEEPVETVEKSTVPTLIARGNDVVTRRVPTMDHKHIVGKLPAGCAYKIKKTVHSAIYGDFYLLENGLYVAKVGNFTIK